MNLLIVIPAYNEADSIQGVMTDIKEAGNWDVLVVDDASTDETVRLVNELGVKTLQLPYNMGAWKATQTGLRYAQNHGYDNVLTFDADGQHLAKSIVTLCEAHIEQQADITIGSCPDRGGLSKKLAWAVFRKISGLQVRDITSGLRLYGSTAINVLSSRQASLLEFQDLGVLVMLKAFKLKKLEVEVDMDKRQVGKSRIFRSWRAIFYYMAYTLLLSVSKISLKLQNKP